MKKKIVLLYIIIFIFIFINNQLFAQLEKKIILNQPLSTIINSTQIDIETQYIGDYLFANPPYPIPAKNYVNTLVYWDKRYDFNKAEINVYNTEGIKICGKDRISIEQQSDWSSIVTWNTSGFPFGIYIILIKHGSATIPIKVVIG